MVSPWFLFFVRFCPAAEDDVLVINGSPVLHHRWRSIFKRPISRLRPPDFLWPHDRKDTNFIWITTSRESDNLYELVVKQQRAPASLLSILRNSFG